MGLILNNDFSGVFAFSSNSCVFSHPPLQFFSNFLPLSPGLPRPPQFFSNFSYPTRFGARSLLRTHVHPYGLYKHSYQPAHTSPRAYLPCPSPPHPLPGPATAQPTLILPDTHAPTRSHPARRPNPTWAHACPSRGPPPKTNVGSGRTGLLMCGLRAGGPVAGAALRTRGAVQCGATRSTFF